MAEFIERGVGAVLLRIVSRGQALITELLRLSDRVPPAFDPSSDPRYVSLLFDFKYFKSPELYEERIEANPELLALDDEFRESYSHILERFFLLFDGIVKYYHDLLQYVEDLQEGSYIQSTVESVLENEDGRQLLVEALFLHGVLLLLLEHRLKGDLRERLVVCYIRSKGTSEIPNFDTICMLCHSSPLPSSSAFTSVAAFAPFLQSSPLPVPTTMLMINKSEELFARFPLPRSIVILVIGRLRNDDLYNQIRHYPNPEHRGTALGAQAGCLYVLLYYTPEMLHNDSNAMREIVDKFFKECWVIPIYMGFTVDLSVAWDRFKAAKLALASTLAGTSVRDIAQRHASKVGSMLQELNDFLSEGVLTHDYVLNNIQILVSCLRNCNVTLRWFLLHHNTASKKLRDLVVTTGESHAVNEESLLSLLLDTSRLEFELKQVYGDLLTRKEKRWLECKTQAAECMQELADFFSGSQVLSKKVKDENLQRWFLQMAAQVGSLDYKAALKAGRKVQHMIAALHEVEQFHQIEGSLQTKQYLFETRAQLQEMIRTLNVQESTLATVSLVSDAAYAWGLIGAYSKQIHARIQVDLSAVVKLQCLFLKLRSIMDIPLLRISQCSSEDLFSVSEYYSSELVSYIRTVLDIIPISIFNILNDVVAKQTQYLHDLPGRLEKESLRDFAQLGKRYTLAKATHQVAVLSQGIMAMTKTFIGVIEMDPRQLLEDGIRKQLVQKLASSLHTIFVFQTGRGDELEGKLQDAQLLLQSQRRSMEYLQDYVHVHGLRLWREEFTRIVNYSVEQECNQYLKRKVQDWQSTYQDRDIPIPQFPFSSKDHSRSLTFMGRISHQLLRLTDPSRSMYLAPMSGWFDATGQELVGLRTFTILQESLGAAGMLGIDRILSFDAARTLQQSVTALCNQIDSNLTERLELLESALTPPSAIPDVGLAVYKELGAGSSAWEFWVESVAHVGQIQLLRCLIASQLRAVAKVESSLVSFALDGMNKSVAAEMRNLSKNETTGGAQLNNASKLLGELSKELQICGLHSPLEALYITREPPDYFALIVFLITISQLPRYVLDPHLGTLTSRMKKAAIDFCPLVVGLATLFQQFHPSHTALYAQYLAQYVRTHVESIPLPSLVNDSPKKVPADSHMEVNKTLTWILALFRYLRMPIGFIEAGLPPIIYDGMAS